MLFAVIIGQSVGSFKGFAGSVRCIEYCHETDCIAACGLDRFLRVYDFKSRNLLQKVKSLKREVNYDFSVLTKWHADPQQVQTWVILS